MPQIQTESNLKNFFKYIRHDIPFFDEISRKM
jgi:hypothetical protein